MMFPNHSDAQEHSQRNPHGPDTELTDSTTGAQNTGYRSMFAMQVESDMGPSHSDNVHPSAAEGTRTGMASTQTMAITTPSDRNGTGYPSYNIDNVIPPTIPRIRVVPLPALSPNVPMRIHTLITYRPSVVLIYWNMSLPPSTARLATNVGSGGRWFRDAAVVPVVSSITIRIRGVSRPVVVFPVEAGHPIRIIDILRGVYNATRAEALENEMGFNDLPAYGAHEPSSREVSFDDSVAADAIQRHFRNRVWWWGLSPSMNEVDVWVLHLRGLSRGVFRR